MSELFKEYGIVNAAVQDALLAFVRADTVTTFQPSQLYSPSEEKKFIDRDIRSSEFRLITAPAAFEIGDQLVHSVNELDRTYDFLLFRNDITHIRYKPGGFFKAHEDYLSLKSNAIVEFTMLVCLHADADIVGGETVFHINDWFRHTSKSSTTPGHVLIFRKDLRHEGRMLEKGMKEILTFNLLGIPKKEEITIAVCCLKSDQVRVTDVKEDINSGLHAVSSAAATGSGPLKQVKMEYDLNTKFVMPLDSDADCVTFVQRHADPVSSSSTASVVSPSTSLLSYAPTVHIPQFFLPLSMVRNTGHSLLEAFASNMGQIQAQSNQGCTAESRIWMYKDSHCSPQEFETIYKIYNKCYITVAEFKQHRALIDFYGFRLSDILIDMSSIIGNPAVPRSPLPAISFRDDVILCLSESHANHVQELIMHECLPYIRFKTILAEGSLSYGGGMSDVTPTLLEMTPLWLVFGDDWHIVFKSHFISTNTRKLDLSQHLTKHHDCWKKHQENCDHMRDCCYPTYVFGLELQEDSDTTLSDVIAQLINPDISLIPDPKEEEEEEEEKETTEEKIEEDAQGGEVGESDRSIGAEATKSAGVDTDIQMNDTSRYKNDKESDATFAVDAPTSPVTSPYYDLCGTSKHKQLLRPQHYTHIMQRIQDVSLLEDIRTQIRSQNLAMLLPQSKHHQSHHFCNESVYGSASFVVVDGFMRMSGSD